jgi:hypothetical protein
MTSAALPARSTRTSETPSMLCRSSPTFFTQLWHPMPSTLIVCLMSLMIDPVSRMFAGHSHRQGTILATERTNAMA